MDAEDIERAMAGGVVMRLDLLEEPGQVIDPTMRRAVGEIAPAMG
jgi:hypothetical protein